MLLSGAASAAAGGTAVLTDQMLDRVTAGGAIVVTSADAQALGVLSLTNATGNSLVVGGPSPYPGQPGLAPSMGAAEGTAVAVGTNLAFQNQPPPSSATSVITNGAADGNLVIKSTINHTTTGAGGVTFQAGWTVVYGAWVGL